MLQLDTGSAVAFVGHPVHAMLVHFPIALSILVLGFDVFFWLFGDPFFACAATWAVGGAFLSGVAASLVGIAEVLLVPRHPPARRQLEPCGRRPDLSGGGGGELGPQA